MRITAIILSLLILILSCIPCGDAIASHVPHNTTTSDSRTTDEESDHMDLCSPFCQCSCCATFSIVNVPVGITFKVFDPVGSIYTDHINVAVIEISLPVWQPPQLV